MRFATYEQHGRSRLATVEDDGVLYPCARRASLLDLIQAGPEALREAGDASLDEPRGPHVSEVRLLPPLRPPSVRDFVTFEEHVEGVRRSIDGITGAPDAWYDAPTFYFTNPYAVIGAHDDVPVPPGSQVLDFELEVAAVIGREGRDLTPGQARDHIVGYTILNDWSARDLQSREMQVGLGPCKGKDTATTLGPHLVTADELEPYRDSDGFLRLALTAEINGEVVGRDLLSNMSWTFEEMTAYASRGTYVRPGDVLGSGTCGNGGCLAELWGVRGRQDPPPLKPGDTVTLTVEGIGTVSNTVVPGAKPVAVPRARTRPRTRP
ncbi:2-keto-4-pentenoate hydratase/2-oxohepta-3-ene-1,7-dioic acid hydratase in catechol pathway [Streptomyces achromogenes]|uniref:2-keto-4-pentenoate hydratase/2-oxohepta-3-ene-1,7-dioic acid hydratase in catechol pathway n=1 Tax=Streptomyces achromogenes TaxID=67255 RepID=A0ABU0PW01_STRAH|nr:fumarylacetoacetate hydrolase family protein [Streptomyces achromogenes]MDQ0681870.1 2-keto-4-pentenoate hydratase/2-oxohepta-3-ene-1,7-dioic acid hydratase in catechol pathway [Streptomyces achromogenes]